MAGGWRVLGRRRLYTDGQTEETKLRRCLSWWQLSALGLGSTLGVGVYVAVGQVALLHAGPSIVLSFLIAGVAALFAGLCYAEFGARVPRAGAAYSYVYAAGGEAAAFCVGWINIFEYVFSAASLARGLSTHVDAAAGGAMSAWFLSAAPLGAPLSPHFDVLAFLIVIVIGGLLATGARASATVNTALSAVNMLTIAFIIIAGACVANSDNWRIPVEQVPDGGGSGGFFPHGTTGMLHGAAVCFYAFSGFDSISAAGEEVKNPKRALPLTIIFVLVAAALVYMSVAIVTTMMVPYYELAEVASIFSHLGMDWAQWIVIVGAIFGISASLFGALYPLSRLLYSMASDGLFFHFFSHVNSWKHSPVVATVVPTAVIAILAGILDLNQLVLMLAIGTLISYTMVAGCVLLVRYRSSDVSEDHPPSRFKQIVGFGEKSPSRATTCLVEAVILLFLVACVSSGLVMRYARSPVVPAAVINVLAAALLLIMALQPRVTPEASFKTPLVPIIPCLSIYVNIHLMIFIRGETWIRIAIWMLIGIPFYILFLCCYKRKEKNHLEENITSSHANKNGKAPIQIVVESPTPPDTMNRSSNGGGNSVPADDFEIVEMQEKSVTSEIMPYEIEEIAVQHEAIIETHEEKEAKIIDMLDKVLQAEEDAYGEIISLKDKEENDAVSENVVHRNRSLSELSDAGSDASLGIQVLSKYDVIAQVHREDLPKVTEEKSDNGEADILDNNEENEDNEDNEENEEVDQVSAFNDSDNNSRTDESGYSDTIDRTALGDSTEDVKDAPFIPVPPPMDENFFASPNFKKAYTVPKRPARRKSIEQEENKPRESIQSNTSQGDGTIIFGSDRQINFMSKLNNIFQKQITIGPTSGEEEEEQEHRKRSNSTGNVVDTELSISQERPAFFADLKKMIVSKEAAQNLRPVITEPKEVPEIKVNDNSDDEDEQEETSMSRQDLKSKLEGIFANGGHQLLKPRLMKSNPPTPEESYQTDTSSTESIAKLPKVDKNDTLKRQKDRFGEVLNSFRLSLNRDDVV